MEFVTPPDHVHPTITTPGNATLPSGDLVNFSKSNKSTTPGNATLPSGDLNSYCHSRGYLPHIESHELIQHVTFHLSDSLAKEALTRLDHELKSLPSDKHDAARRMRIQSWLDAGHGSCILRQPELASLVQQSLLHFHGQRYFLHAWVVMPNHVHTLFQPARGWEVRSLVASWKKFTARGIVASCAESPPFASVWHREYWDRYIRDEAHYERARFYIEQNPVSAGLVTAAEEWPWSSANPENENLLKDKG